MDFRAAEDDVCGAIGCGSAPAGGGNGTMFPVSECEVDLDQATAMRELQNKAGENNIGVATESCTSVQP